MKSIFLIFLAAIAIGGCSNVDDPGQIVEKYSKAEFSGDYKLAYSYLSKSQKIAKSEEEYLKKRGAGAITDPLQKKCGEHVKCKVKKVSISGDTASVETDLLMPDFSPVVMSMVMNPSATSEKTVRNSMEQLINKGNVPNIRTNLSVFFDLVKESGQWKIAKTNSQTNVGTPLSTMKKMVKDSGVNMPEEAFKNLEDMAKKHNIKN